MKTRDFSLILSIGIILSIIRIAFSNNEYLDYIMAAINLVALNYILWCISNDTVTAFEKYEDQITYGKSIFNKKLKHLNKAIKIFELLFFFILSPIYLLFFSNATINDVISIIALCVSIESVSISLSLAKHLYLLK